MDTHTSTIRKSVTYKLRPTPAHAHALEAVLWRCRVLDTCALEQRRTWWGRGQGKRASYSQQKAELPDLKAAFPDYVEVNAQVVPDVLLRVARAYQACFRRVQAGESPGYPRFQGPTRYKRFTYPQVGAHGGARLDHGALVLSKIGRIGLRWSRPREGTPKTVTVSREAHGWYAGCSCADIPMYPLPPAGRETGLDVGLKVFLVTADGGVVENPRHYRRGEQRLAKAQRRVSRRQKGSNRRKKALVRLARAQQHIQHIKRQRADHQHKTARVLLLRAYDVRSQEDLRIATLLRNHHLAKSSSAAGWVQFRTILAGKAAYAGKTSGGGPATVHQPGR